MSKPVTALAIMVLIQRKYLMLHTTMKDLGIDMPRANSITVWHLLNHLSGMHDHVSQLYFHKQPRNLYNKIIEAYSTKFLPPSNMLELVRAGPSGRLLKRSKYNNAGYDLLGYIIFLVSGMKTSDFVRKNIFTPLGMHASGFQHEQHPSESQPYTSDGRRGIKEQQNFYCGNAFVVSSMDDVCKLLNNYPKLLNQKALATFESLYFFTIPKSQLFHTGSGDFENNFSVYEALSRSMIFKWKHNKHTLLVVAFQSQDTTLLPRPLKLNAMKALKSFH